MIARLPGMVVLPGFACNFFCGHCIARDRAKGRLTPEELEVLSGAIRKYGVKKLGFAGGEPTLHRAAIKKLLALSGFAGAVSLTTNGHFAATVPAAKKELSQYPGLRSVQLSYDKFHAKFLPLSKVRNLHAACAELGLKFSIVLTVQSPLDLVLVSELRELGDFRIGVQRVIPGGEAKKNGFGYKHPAFDRRILSKGCPNRNTMSFLHGYGFSVCCGAPDLPAGAMAYAHRTLEEHARSRFYRLIKTKTFGGIARELRVPLKDLSPECSEPCVLCEKIFSSYAKNATAAV